MNGTSTMSSSKDLSLLVARVLLAALFIMAGLGKLSGVDGFAGYMASGGVPAFLAWPVILFEILGGLALLAGVQTRVVALALAAFCVVSGVLYHFDPADQMQMTSFLKNVALSGGYLALAVTGAGRFSVDALTGGRPVAA
jgi:putative oxidoreductase